MLGGPGLPNKLLAKAKSAKILGSERLRAPQVGGLGGLEAQDLARRWGRRISFLDFEGCGSSMTMYVFECFGCVHVDAFLCVQVRLDSFGSSPSMFRM